MALRDIVLEGDPILRQKAREITKFDKRLHALLDDMAETLAQADGVGLAAPQVGVSRRVVVLYDGDKLVELVNPVITYTEGTQEFEEGCLSVPGYQGHTVRPAYVRVSAQDRNGAPLELEGRELLAVIFCHEIDHLDGKLYIDIVQGDLMEIEN